MQQGRLGERFGAALTRTEARLARAERRWLGWFWLALLLVLVGVVGAAGYTGWLWLAGVLAALGLAVLGFAFWQRHGWLVSAVAPAVVVLAIGAVVLFGTGQGRDLGASIVDAGRLQLFCFGAALLYWAAAVWHNARVRVDVVFDNRSQQRLLAAPEDDPATQPNERPWQKWTPRVLGAVVFVLAAAQLVMVGWAIGFDMLIWPLGVVGLTFVLYWLIVVYRRDKLVPWLRGLVRGVSGWLEGQMVEAATLQSRALVQLRVTGKPEFDDEVVAPTSAIITSLVFIALGLAVAVPAWFVPVELGWLVGSMALGFFAFGFYLVLLTLLWIWANRRGFGVWRVLVPLLLVAVAGTFTRPYHEVRLVAGDLERPSLATMVAEWRDNAALVHDGDAAVPMIFVATAGGGLRAAYWTATVLAELERQVAERTGEGRAFRHHLYAISGVSGGSVGAAYFTRDAGPDAPRALEDSPVLRSLERDFLAPTLASLAFVDMPSLVLPNWGQPSRGIVLERAFEAGFRQGTGQDLDIPFLAARQGDRWQPLLLLNGTHQKSGRRLIASHVELTSDAFLDSFDLHHLLKSDIRLSTAAHNSARFTYVSPAGTLTGADGEALGHVIDGGYFENFGAVTMLQLVRAVMDELAETPMPRPVQPIIVQISSDPGISERDRAALETVAGCADGTEAPLPFEASDKSDFWANSQLLAPVRGILATRQAQGILASKELAQLACRLGTQKPQPVFVHFAMCDAVDPPLGWVMSGGSRQAIRELVHGCGNERLFERVVEAFGSAVPITD